MLCVQRIAWLPGGFPGDFQVHQEVALGNVKLESWGGGHCSTSTWQQWNTPTNVLCRLLLVLVVKVSRYDPGSFRGWGHKGLWKLCSELRAHKPEPPVLGREKEGTREAVPLLAYTQVEGGGATRPQLMLDSP